MAKKDTDNFDFEVEGEGKEKGKINLNLDFIKNLTKQQKGIILAALVGIILVIAIIVVVVIVGAGNGGNTTGGGTNPGGNNSQIGGGGSGGASGEISDLQISIPPYKTVYYVGDSANYEGLYLTYRDANNDSKYVFYADEPEAFTITGFDSSVPTEEQTVTVEYKGCSATFKVKILEIPVAQPTLVSIYLNPAPRDTAKAGVALSVKDAKIVCVYSDGSEKFVKLTHSHLYGYENELMNASVGDVITVHVRYTEDGYVAETTYTVTVIE